MCLAIAIHSFKLLEITKTETHLSVPHITLEGMCFTSINWLRRQVRTYSHKDHLVVYQMFSQFKVA